MIRQILQSGFAAGLGQILSAASLPVLARIYAPDDFAAWAVVVATVGIVAVVASARYELAVVIPEDRAEASDLFWGGIGTICLGSAAAGGIAAWLASADGGGSPSRFGAIEAAAIHTLGVFAAGGYAMLAGWCIRVRRFGLAAGSQVVQAIATVATQLAIAFWSRPSPEGLVWGFVGGLAAADAYMLARLVAARQGPSATTGWAGVRSALVRFRRFPVFSMPTMLCSVSRDRASVLVMEGRVSQAAVGEYALVQRLAAFPVSLANSAVRPILFNEAARDGAGTLEPKVTSLIRLMLLVTLPWLAITLVLADDLLPWFLGRPWADQGNLLRILVIPAYGAMLVTWMDRLLESEGRQRLAFGFEAGSAIISLAALAAGLVGWGSLRAGLACQAVALVACSAIYLTIVFRVLRYRVLHLGRVLPAAGGGFALVWTVTEASRRMLGPAPALVLATLAVAILWWMARGILARELATIRGPST